MLLMCIAIGITTLTFIFITYLKKRDFFLIKIMMFYASLTIPPFFGTIIIYLNINKIDLFINNTETFHYISVILANSSLFFISFITTSIIKIKNEKIINLICAIFSILITFIGVVSSKYLETSFKMYMSNYNKQYLLHYLQLLPILYLCCLVFIKNKLREEMYKNWLGARLSLVLLFSLPLIISDIFRIFTDYFFFLPIVYIILSIQIIQYLTKLFNYRNYPINSFELTNREQELVYLIITGNSNKDISDKLHISLSTVKNHIYNIYRKVNVKNRFELISKLSS